MRIYLMAVGKQDPFTMQRPGGSLDFNKIFEQYGPAWASQNLPLSDGPILSFLDRQPIAPEDWVVLISTQGEPPVVDSPTLQGGEATKAELRKRHKLSEDHILHEPLRDVDPSNFGAIARPMRQLVSRLLDDIRAQASTSDQIEYVVNVSPGTPQMQAVWYLMANFGQLHAKLFQIKQRPDRIEPVSLSPLLAEQFIELGLRFFQDYSFRAASESFKRAADVLETYEPERARHAQLAQKITAAYHNWSIFQHQKAADTLRQLLGPSALDRFPELFQTINQQTEFLQKLSHPIPKFRAVNLFHAARLEYDRHDMVEAIWRAGAAYEQVLLERALRIAEQQCGFRPNPFNFRESIEQQLGTATLPMERQRLQTFHNECRTQNILQEYLGISLVIPLLENWDTEFCKDSFWKKAKTDLADVRNNAVHRSEQVSPKQVMAGLQILQEALKRTFGNEISQELDACPFSSQRLQGVKEHLAALVKG